MEDHHKIRVKLTSGLILYGSLTDVCWETNPDGRLGLGSTNHAFVQIREDIELQMNCTGLKDKNGQMIYEGDILEFPPSGKIYKSRILQVKYLKYEWAPMSRGFHRSEIIGNIHENPELLKGK